MSRHCVSVQGSEKQMHMCVCVCVFVVWVDQHISSIGFSSKQELFLLMDFIHQSSYSERFGCFSFSISVCEWMEERANISSIYELSHACTAWKVLVYDIKYAGCSVIFERGEFQLFRRQAWETYWILLFAFFLSIDRLPSNTWHVCTGTHCAHNENGRFWRTEMTASSARLYAMQTGKTQHMHVLASWIQFVLIGRSDGTIPWVNFNWI